MSEQLTHKSNQEESSLLPSRQLKAAPGRLIARHPQSAKPQQPQIIKSQHQEINKQPILKQEVPQSEKKGKKSKSQSASHRRGVQKKTKRVVISTFDKLEEARYKSYETQQILAQMVDLINRQGSMGKGSTDSFVALSQDSWNEIKTLANDASSLFHASTADWDSVVDMLSSEVNEYKQICQRMKTKLESIRRDRFDQRRNHEDTLMDIASAYNKGRTQLFTVMDEIELATHYLKNGIEKRNVKQISYITHIEKDIEDAFSDLLQNSTSERMMTMQNQSSRNDVNPMSLGQKVHQTYQQYQDNENAIVITPRGGQQPLSARRGRSQQPAQKESRAEVLPPQHPNVESKRFNIPLLPIHMINNQRDQQQNSNRGGIPTAPLSHRSHQQLVAVPSQSQLSNRLSSRRQSQLPPTHSNHQQLSARGGNVSQRSKNGGMRQDFSGRHSNHDTPGGQGQDSKRSIQGGIIDGEYLVNPVFLGAVYQTSRFDKALEDDYEDADQTLPFETDRLRQYADEYEMIMHVEDEEQRILLKQWLFMIHEKELKSQAKKEKVLRIQQRRAARAAAQDQNQQNRHSFDGTTPRGARGSHLHDENEQTLKEPSVEVPMPRNENSEQRNGMIDESFTGSHISLQRGSLPLLGTIEMISARRKEMLNDVQLNQLLDVPLEIHGLIKTLTEKSMILKIEQEYLEKEELKREDRKVLEWSSHDGGTDSSFVTDSTPADVRHSVESSKKSVANAQVIVNLDNPQVKGRRLYSNGAINIMDMIHHTSQQDHLVGEFTPEKSQNCPFELNTSPQSSEIEYEHQIQLDQNLKVELVNQKRSRHAPQAPKRVIQKKVDNFVFPEYDSEDLYQVDASNVYLQAQNLDQLEIIHERQSELSSSINTQNRQLSRLSSHRNGKMQLNNNLAMLIPPQPQQMSRQGDHRVLSARENSQQASQRNGVDFNKLQYLQPPSIPLQLPIPNKSFEVGTKNSEVREEKYKRCKSHRNSLQSAPNSQRGAKPSSKKILLGEDNNFHSIQEHDYLCEDQIAQIIQSGLDKSRGQQEFQRRPVTELRQHGCEIESQTSDSFEDSRIQYKMESEVHHKNKMFARRLSPIITEYQLQQCPQHFSSIQNQFDESKTSGYKNESLFMNDTSMKFMQSPRAISDRGIEFKDGDELCDFEDIDINQLHQLCNKFIPLSSILRENNDSGQTKQQDHKIGQSPLQHNKILPGTNSQSLRHQFLMNNINSSMLLQGNQSNPSAGLLFPSGTQKHNQSNLMMSRGLTANMITNYLLQNFTQLKLLPGQLTREVVATSRKPSQLNDQQKATQIHGQSGFTLSTLGDETLMYMFPPQKTQRRTLFMLQNFHNNYYNNQAGVLFTMPISTGEINNGFLQQCSTVPSADPDHMCSGGGMTQIQTKQITKQIRHHNHNQMMHPNQSQTTNLNQDSFKEDSQKRYTLPQYYTDHQKQFTAALSKKYNAAALSTGESGTFKSTALGGHPFLRFNPQAITQVTNIGGKIMQNQTSGAGDLCLSPRQSFETNDKNGSNSTHMKQFNTQPKRQISQKVMQNTSHTQADENVSYSQENVPKSFSQQRHLKIIPTKINSSVGGLAKLQAIAGNAHSSAVSAGGGNLIIKKMPNVVKIQKANIMQTAVK